MKRVRLSHSMNKNNNKKTDLTFFLNPTGETGYYLFYIYIIFLLDPFLGSLVHNILHFKHVLEPYNNFYAYHCKIAFFFKKIKKN